MKTFFFRPLQFCLGMTAVLVLGLASCKKDNENHNNDPYSQIQPKGPKPEWAPTITPQMQTVIEKLDSFGTPPLYTLTPQQARMEPSPADALKAVMQDYNIPMPTMNVDTMGMNVPAANGDVHVRIYTPKTGKSSYPVIVYYHGGGWVIANLDTYNSSAQALSEQTDAIVVSVAYRQAPEFKYPTAHNDSYAAYLWALNNAASFKGDSTHVAVAGESAGGNLAAAVSMMARDNGVKIPVHELLVYPIANYDLNSQSYQQYAGAKPLNKPLMQWFFDQYLTSAADGATPWISLVNGNLSGLPSTTIIGAEIDPLQTEGKMLADKLQAAGVPVTYKLYTGVTHEFFGMATVLPEAKDANALAASELKAAFSK